MNSYTMPGFGLLGGLLLLSLGLLKNYKTRRLGRYAVSPAASLKEGEKQLITGRVRALAALTSPVTSRPCAFYLETVEERRGTERARWVITEENAYGGFYVEDASGPALVFPSARSLDLVQPEISNGDRFLAQQIKRERIIADGGDATVIGTPLRLGKLLAELRRGSELQMPTELLNCLLKIEKEGAGQLMCFFGEGAETVADRAYGDYLSGASSSSAFYLQVGGIISALSIAALTYLSMAG